MTDHLNLTIGSGGDSARSIMAWYSVEFRMEERGDGGKPVVIGNDDELLIPYGTRLDYYLTLEDEKTGERPVARVHHRDAIYTRYDPELIPDLRVANSLKLVRELEGYARYQSEHFLVRCRPGIDEVLRLLETAGQGVVWGEGLGPN